jgi:hypothetical protein
MPTAARELGRGGLWNGEPRLWSAESTALAARKMSEDSMAPPATIVNRGVMIDESLTSG